ncbi:MAG: hypothetical protein ABSH45_19925 [Bryobacteraceae bacterium]
MTPEPDHILRCPNCGGRDVRPSHTKGMLDRILAALRKKPYRCRACGRRFHCYTPDRCEIPSRTNPEG